MSRTPSLEADPIRPLRQRLTDAVKAGDVNAIASLFSEEAVLMAPNEPTLYGILEVKEWWEEYFEHFKVTEVTETERDINFFDEGAVERVAYMVAIAPIKEGEPIRDEGRWLSFWKCEADGLWRMQHAMFNSIRPIGSGTSRFVTRMMERKRKV